jgi:hypothetical protein
MKTSERGARVYGMPKALRIAEVRSIRRCRVGSDGGERKGEQGVHLYMNEGVHRPLRTENRGLDKNQAIEILITHIDFIGFHASKKHWWKFINVIDIAKLAMTLRSISLEFNCYNDRPKRIGNTARTSKNDLLSSEERGVRCIPEPSSSGA